MFAPIFYQFSLCLRQRRSRIQSSYAYFLQFNIISVYAHNFAAAVVVVIAVMAAAAAAAAGKRL